jgi:hypothetical protein
MTSDPLIPPDDPATSPAGAGSDSARNVTRKRPNAPSKKSGTNVTRVWIAVIGVLGSLGVAGVKGYFDRIHIDARLSNLRGVDIKSGAWGVGPNDNFNPPWNLGSPQATATSSATRTFTYDVRFPEAFSSTPKVFVTVTGLDASNKSNLRWSAQPTEITPVGFRLQLSAIADTQIYYLEGRWLAFQQVTQ